MDFKMKKHLFALIKIFFNPTNYMMKNNLSKSLKIIRE